MFTIPNMFTSGNLICGVLSIFFCFSGRIDFACYLIYVALLFDFFDGFLARKLGKMGELGKQLDSLADMVTFGVAPGVIACIILIISMSGGINALSNDSFHTQVSQHITIFLSKLANSNLEYRYFICFSGLFIPFFSLFRLAKFNIDMRQTDSFIGLPTPANTLFFSAFPLLLSHYFQIKEDSALLSFLMHPIVFICVIVVMSVLLIAELPLFSLKVKHLKWKENEIRFIFLTLSVFCILFFGAWSILIIVILYLLLSLFETIKTRFT